MSIPSIEQRVFHRLNLQLQVSYRVVTARTGQGPELADGTTVNLSAGGMLLAIPTISQHAVPELLEGQGTLVVRFVPGKDVPAIEARCRVVWMQGPKARGDGFQLGLKFVDLPAAERERLHTFVTEHAA